MSSFRVLFLGTFLPAVSEELHALQISFGINELKNSNQSKWIDH